MPGFSGLPCPPSSVESAASRSEAVENACKALGIAPCSGS
jgi:hypothetical protein